MTKPKIYHIPVCPFSQRVEVLLALRGQSDAVSFEKVDITKPRDPELLKKTDGKSSMPVIELPDGRILGESLVIMNYLDEVLPGTPVRRADPFEHATEQLLIAMEGPIVNAGYTLVMNQDLSQREALTEKLLSGYRKINRFLQINAPEGPFLFEDFGLAEAVYTPIFMRFWFLDYYEQLTLPDTEDYARFRRWREACLNHPAAQQVSEEEIVKNYYDYAMGYGNGALPENRARSSFVFEPDWRTRPWPPREKYTHHAGDEELGLA